MKLKELRSEVERIETGPNNIPYTGWYSHALRISLRRNEGVNINDFVEMEEHAKQEAEDAAFFVRGYTRLRIREAIKHYTAQQNCHKQMAALLNRAWHEGVEV